MRHLAFLLILLLVPSSVLAANRTVKVRGVIGLCGTSQCGIGELNPGYLFLPRTKIASQILSVCGEGDDCEITGVVDDKDYFVSVSRVRSIDTNVEPSASVIKDASCWLYSLSCSDDSGSFYVDYIDIVKIRKILAGEKYEWRVQFIVHGVENYVHKKIGPGEVYLMKHQGVWHYFKTKP